MFLNKCKEFLVKKIIKKSITNVQFSEMSSVIKTVGVIVDNCFLVDPESIIKALETHGLVSENITMIIYSDTFGAMKSCKFPSFGSNDVNWIGSVKSQFAEDFIKNEFDLLISYYTIEKSFLLWITNNSKAKFKAGFAMVDPRLNHFLFLKDNENCFVFVGELFKYLKFIKKKQ